MQIRSSAFVPGTTQKPISPVHELIKQRRFTDEKGQRIKTRDFEKEDVENLRMLQQEWFPIQYSDYFYNKLLRRESICYLAVSYIQLQDQQGKCQEIKTIEIIVGAIVFEITDSQGYLRRQSLWELWTKPTNSVYIMTLGVIDEYRKRGVAKLLIEKLQQQCLRQNEIKLIFLHLVSYNQVAERFYLKNGFQQLQTLQAYYHIGNNLYQGKSLGMFINGGTKKNTWRQWFKRIIYSQAQVN